MLDCYRCVGVGEKPFSKYKLVTLLPDEKIVGLHIIGEGMP